MSLDTYAGSFQLVAGSQADIPVTGVGFQPKLIFFWSVVAEIDAPVNRTNGQFGIGFSDGVTERSYGQAVGVGTLPPEEVVQASFTRRRIAPDALITVTGGGAVSFRIKVRSMDPDGFTIFIPGENPGQSGNNEPEDDEYVYFLALGGDDFIECSIGSFNTAAEAGQQVVSGIGLTGAPDFLMLLGADTPIDTDDYEPVDKLNGNLGNGPHDAVLSLGCGTKINQVVTGIREKSLVPVSESFDTMREEIVAVFEDGGDTLLQSATLLSLDDNAFRLRWTHAAARRMFYLAIRGPAIKVGRSFTPEKPTKKPIPGMNLIPKAMLGFCTSLTPTLPSSISGTGFSFGGGTETYQRCLAINDATARVPVAPRKYVEDALVRIHSTTGQPRGIGRIYEFGQNDVTLDWIISDPPEIQFAFVTFGEPLDGQGVTFSYDNVYHLTASGASIDESIDFVTLVWSGTAAEGHRLRLGESSVLGDSERLILELTSNVPNQTIVVQLPGVEFDKGIEVTQMDSGTLFLYRDLIIVDNINVQEGGINVTNTPHNTLDFDGDQFDLTDHGDGSVGIEVREEGLNHNDLLNAFGDNHVGHSLVILTAGAGLTGGGDITASRTFNVVGANSIVANADDIQLVNDAASPGANRVYGTNGAGTKGWQQLVFGQGYGYAEKTTLQTSTSATFAEYLKLTTASLAAGTYRIAYTAVFGHSSTGNDNQIRAQVDDSINLIDPANGGLFTTRVSVAGARQICAGFRDVALGAAVHTIDIDFATSGGTMTLYFATIDIWRVA